MTKKIEAAITKRKVGVGARELHPNDSWQLLDYLLQVIDQTCRRMGWVGISERNSDTFCKVTAWRAASDDPEVIVFLDADTQSPSVKTVVLPFANEDLLVALGNKLIPSIKTERELFAKAIEAGCTRTFKHLGIQTKEDDAGQSRNDKDPLTEEEKAKRDADRKEIVRQANKLRIEDPQKTWKAISREIGIPERTLRDWRHNPKYQ